MTGGVAGDRKRVDQEDALPRRAPGAGGDRIVLTLQVEDKGGTGIVNEVWDYRTHALAGAGRSAGQGMPVVIKAAAPARGVWQVAERKRVGRGGGFEMPAGSGLRRSAKTGRAVGGRRRWGEQDGPDPAQWAGQQSRAECDQRCAQYQPQQKPEPRGVRLAGHGVKEGEGQPARGRGGQQQ
jgi:hypothetical protein